jgi:hypothetical protein
MLAGMTSKRRGVPTDRRLAAADRTDNSNGNGYAEQLRMD